MITNPLRGQRDRGKDERIIGVPEVAYRRIVTAAVRSGRTLKAVLSEAIERALDDAEARR